MQTELVERQFLQSSLLILASSTFVVSVDQRRCTALRIENRTFVIGRQAPFVQFSNRRWQESLAFYQPRAYTLCFCSYTLSVWIVIDISTRTALFSALKWLRCKTQVLMTGQVPPRPVDSWNLKSYIYTEQVIYKKISTIYISIQTRKASALACKIKTKNCGQNQKSKLLNRL